MAIPTRLGISTLLAHAPSRLKTSEAMLSPVFHLVHMFSSHVRIYPKNDIKLKGRFTGLLIFMAIPARFERATHSLEGCCSIQLSYGTKTKFL